MRDCRNCGQPFWPERHFHHTCHGCYWSGRRSTAPVVIGISNRVANPKPEPSVIVAPKAGNGGWGRSHFVHTPKDALPYVRDGGVEQRRRFRFAP